MFPVTSWPATATGPTTVAPPQRYYQQQDNFPGPEPNGYGHQPYHPDNPILIRQLQGYPDLHYRNGIPPSGSSVQMHHYPPPPAVSPYPSQSDFIPMGPPPPRASPVNFDRYTPNGFQNNREAIVISSPSPAQHMSMQANSYFAPQCQDQQQYLHNGFNRHAPSPVLYAALNPINRPQPSPFSSTPASIQTSNSNTQEQPPSPSDDSIQILEERPGKRHLQQEQRQPTESPAKPKSKVQKTRATSVASSDSKSDEKHETGEAAPKAANEDRKQQAVCPVEDCRKVMATRKTLERHFQIHVKTQDVHCPVCKREFETPYQRGNHVFKVHRDHYPKYKAGRDQDEYEVKIKQMCFQVLKTHEMEQKSKATNEVNRVVIDEDEDSRQSSVTSSAKNASGSEEGLTETDGKKRGTGPLKCHICGPGKGYSSWKAYKRHWKTIHVKLEPDGGGVSCDFCQQTFKDLTTDEGYNQHCQAHCHSYVRNRKIWLFDDDAEDTELRIVEVASVAPEPTCEGPPSYGQATTDTAELEKDKPYICQVQGCVARFKRRQHLESHNVKHHGNGGSFACPMPSCLRRFVYKHDLKNHVRGIHKEVYDQTSDDGIRRSDLPKDKGVDQRTSAAPAPLIHNYQCVICNSTFIKLTGLQSHIRKVHPEEHETQFQHISKDQLKEMSKRSTSPNKPQESAPPTKRKFSTPSKLPEGSPNHPGVPLFSSTRLCRSVSMNSLVSLEPNFNSDHELDEDVAANNKVGHQTPGTSVSKRQKVEEEQRIHTAMRQQEPSEDVYHSVNIKVLPYNQGLPVEPRRRSRNQKTIVIQELPTPSQHYTAETKAEFIRGCRFPILKVEPDVEIIDQIPPEQPGHLEVLLCPDPKCSRSFSSKAKLKVHLKHKKGQRSKCKKCKGSWFHPYGKKFPHCPTCKKQLDERKKRKATERFRPSSWVKTISITCFECAQQFQTEQALRSHLLESHMNPVSERQCPTCSFMLEDAIEFWVHTRAHAFDRARPIDCTQQLCKHRFQDDQDLQLHLKVHHGLAADQSDHRASFSSSNTSSSTSSTAVRKNLSDMCLADLLASSPCAPKIKPYGDSTPVKNISPSPISSQLGSSRKRTPGSSKKRDVNSQAVVRPASKSTSPESKTSQSTSNASLSTPDCSGTSDSSKEAEDPLAEDSQHGFQYLNPIYPLDSCSSTQKLGAQPQDAEALQFEPNDTNGFEPRVTVNIVKGPEKITLKSSSLKSNDNENV